MSKSLPILYDLLVRKVLEKKGNLFLCEELIPVTKKLLI